jgi:hypothetical protein
MDTSWKVKYYFKSIKSLRNRYAISMCMQNYTFMIKLIIIGNLLKVEDCIFFIGNNLLECRPKSKLGLDSGWPFAWS